MRREDYFKAEEEEFSRLQPTISKCKSHPKTAVSTWCDRCRKVLCKICVPWYRDYVEGGDDGQEVPNLRLCRTCDREWRKIWEHFYKGEAIQIAAAEWAKS